ncbi:6556_t:CDS:2, partial [Racocetra persica]
VTIFQSITLQVQTLQNKPNIYDLPIVPAFRNFSAPVQDPSEPHGDNAIFHLKKGIYNSINGKTTNLSVIFEDQDTEDIKDVEDTATIIDD